MEASLSFYEERILPHAIDLACGMPLAMELRKHVVPRAEGVVLEVGMGSGLNLSLYDPEKTDFVWGLEPSPGMRRKALANLKSSPVEVKWLDLPGEQIPLDDASVDTVMLTFTLCSIPDWRLALEQMYRVLKPGGKLWFCEHGRAPDEKVARWQDRLTPVWKRFAGGCHLNRPISDYIAEVGFSISELNNQYIDRSPKMVGYMYYGLAEKV